MIIGQVEDIGRGYLRTHKDTYAITDQTHRFVVRPFRPIGTSLACALVGFAWGCFDLLYVHELAILAGCAVAAIVAGERIAHLAIVNRDLPGSQLSIALWGSAGTLNAVRKQIDAANPKGSHADRDGEVVR